MTTAATLAKRVDRLERALDGGAGGWSEPTWYTGDVEREEWEPFTPAQELRDYVREEVRRLWPEVSGWHVAFWVPDDSCGSIVILASGENAEVVEVPQEVA